MSTEYQLPPKLPTSYSEADFDGYHAAPLLIYGSEAKKGLIKRQDHIAVNFAGATKEVFEGVVKPGVVNFVTRSIITRMEQREGLNSISYANRHYKYPRFDLAPHLSAISILKATHRTKVGSGSISENATSGRVFGMDSVELGNITVLGEFRADIRDEMYQDASEFFGVDIVPAPDQEYDKIRVIEFDRDIEDDVQHIGAMRIEMTRRLIERANGSVVKARRFAIIDTSPASGFGEDTIDRLVSAARAHRPLSPKATKWLIEREQPTWRVLASNDTIYEQLSN